MKLRILFFLMIITLNLVAQSKLLKGYIINNNGKKIDCFFKENEWFDTDYYYKISEERKLTKVNISNIQEFGVPKIFKFERHTVDIDLKSKNFSNSISDFDYDRNPTFTKKTLFLKVLVMGKANLYLYQEQKLIRFFFSIENTVPKQLIYKKYKISSYGLKYNNQYKQQLITYLQCDESKLKNTKTISYREKSLSKIFINYNNCIQSNYVFYKNSRQSSKIGINIRPRISFNDTQLLMQYLPPLETRNPILFNYGKSMNYGLGIEMEIFFNNKVSLTLEPNFITSSRLSNQYEEELGSLFKREGLISLSYQEIAIPIGFRYYFPMNKKSKLFLDSSYSFGYSINTNLRISGTNFSSNNNIIDNFQYEKKDSFDIRYFSFGVGYIFDKYSVEFRVDSVRKPTTKLWNYNFLYNTNSFGFILGYKLF